MPRLEPAVLGYTTLRLGIGMSMIIHGVGRIGNIPGFAKQLVSHFSKTWLPDALVIVFAYVTPPVELLIGILG
jgi:thiosulfate dehydrogenase (quinone) large subunit